MIGDSFGFIFAFKVYRGYSKEENDILGGEEDNGARGRGFVDCLENLVHRITHSDIIHVEIIPVLGSAPTGLTISQTAYSAYIGLGFDEHDSSFCITDPTYKLVYIPMTHGATMRGIEYLHSQRGKQYNYLALPLTVLPSWCKKRSFASHKRSDEAPMIIVPEVETLAECNENPCDVEYNGCYYYHYDCEEPPPSHDAPTRDILLSPSKVFCSQLGLTLCYLCSVFPESYDFSSAFPAARASSRAPKPFFIDPMCCTPAELYRLLLSTDHHAVAAHWPQSGIVIHETH
jgi:hypothetical protein